MGALGSKETSPVDVISIHHSADSFYSLSLQPAAPCLMSKIGKEGR